MISPTPHRNKFTKFLSKIFLGEIDNPVPTMSEIKKMKRKNKKKRRY